ATAVCADGSRGFFYKATNASSSDYVFFLGGGVGSTSCAHAEALCDEDEGRELGGGDRGEDVRGTSILAAGEIENPLFATYNRLYLPHCSSDMFL
ncbi:unnamed protein product, partial [Hapterophycus canaliculatus]